MATIIIHDVPDEVMNKLNGEARLRDVPTERVAIDMIARSEPILPQRRSTEELLRLADAVRIGSRESWLTPEFIKMAKEDGRP